MCIVNSKKSVLRHNTHYFKVYIDFKNINFVFKHTKQQFRFF